MHMPGCHMREIQVSVESTTRGVSRVLSRSDSGFRKFPPQNGNAETKRQSECDRGRWQRGDRQ
jgi:hypothetical protein